MADFPDDVDVVVVSHNGLKTLAGTLGSLISAACPVERITVVDVASTDGTCQYLSAAWPRVRQIPLGHNLGPSPGRNAGLLSSTSAYTFLMDADVRVEPDTVSLLRQAMTEDPAVAIGSPVVLHENRPELIQYAGTSLHFICEAENPWLDRPLRERGDHAADIGVASTCALLIDRARALHYGLFDERYFIGKEDGDFTHRARLAGFKIRELPQARVYHHSRKRGTWLFYYQVRNRWHFLLKNYEWRTLLVLAPILAVHETLQVIVLVSRGHAMAYLKALAGLLTMLPDLPRDRRAVRQIRVLHDSAVLTSGSLVARDDITGGGWLRRAFHLYEAALASYWAVARRFLPK